MIKQSHKNSAQGLFIKAPENKIFPSINYFNTNPLCRVKLIKISKDSIIVPPEKQ